MKKHYLNLEELQEVKHHEKQRFESLLTSFMLLSLAFFLIYFLLIKLF